MLDGTADPTIRFAIIRRLDAEPGVKICDLQIQQGDGFFAVGVLVTIGETIRVTSRFDLPIPFELAHLHDEIDEIAEQFKAARKGFFGGGGGFLMQPERQLEGTGLRGRWVRYG